MSPYRLTLIKDQVRLGTVSGPDSQRLRMLRSRS
jgi:hypothetical protein